MSSLGGGVRKCAPPLCEKIEIPRTGISGEAYVKIFEKVRTPPLLQDIYI